MASLVPRLLEGRKGSLGSASSVRDPPTPSLPQPDLGWRALAWERWHHGRGQTELLCFWGASLTWTKVTEERVSKLNPLVAMQPRQGRAEGAQGVPMGWALSPATYPAQGPAALPWAASWKRRAQPSCLGPAASNYALHKALDVKSAAEAGRWRRWKGATSKVSGRGEGNAISVVKPHAYSNLLCDCATNLGAEKKTPLHVGWHPHSASGICRQRVP